MRSKKKTRPFSAYRATSRVLALPSPFPHRHYHHHRFFFYISSPLFAIIIPGGSPTIRHLPPDLLLGNDNRQTAARLTGMHGSSWYCPSSRRHHFLFLYLPTLILTFIPTQILPGRSTCPTITITITMPTAVSAPTMVAITIPSTSTSTSNTLQTQILRRSLLLHHSPPLRLHGVDSKSIKNHHFSL